ncbi:MAG: zf-HC2 domain-containing protein [Caldilineaceae bacterium]|nr:zf-HC2 domain-containing protein [Caldilineaceae bacterium]
MTVLQPQPLVPTEDEADMNTHDEYGMLMSLSLDNLLDGREQAQLDAHLADCNRCRAQWSLWKSLDGALHAAPMTAPSPAFVQRVGHRLAAQDRRRQMRVGILLGALTIVMWLIGVTGIALVIGALIYNQVGWFTESLHWLAYMWTAVTVVGSSLLALLGGVAGEPSAIGLLGGYVILAGGVLAMWSRYLRRSLQRVEVFQ